MASNPFDEHRGLSGKVFASPSLVLSEWEPLLQHIQGCDACHKAYTRHELHWMCGRGERLRKDAKKLTRDRKWIRAGTGTFPATTDINTKGRE